MNFLRNRNTERLFLLLGGGILLFLSLRLYDVLKKDFEEVPKRLADGTMVNLNEDGLDQRIKGLLEKGFYFEDPRDVRLAASVVSSGMSKGGGEMDNIGELNKNRFMLPTATALAEGGESYRKRAFLSRALLGFSGDDSLRYDAELSNPPQLSMPANAALGDGSLGGLVKNNKGEALPGILVRLRLLLPDTAFSTELTDTSRVVAENTNEVKRTWIVNDGGRRELQSLTAYTRTDKDGAYRFTGLLAYRTYEVLPMHPRYNFGGSKGITSLGKKATLSFNGSDHAIRLFSTRDFNNLKKERALIVRTPEEVTKWYRIAFIVFFAAFLALHIFLTIFFPKADQLILPVVMLLTGISFLTLLSLQDPLRDRFLARSTLGYFTAGAVIIFLLLFFNLRKFTTDSGLFRLFIFRNHPRAANGWPWAIAAALLLILTILFGSGPEGSGVKVNLFGFQPSEIVKFLLLVFLAGFFTANEKFISEYARWQKRWSFFSFALAAIIGSILLFLLLGDLGPAMVVCFTFIVLFSFSRGDFALAAGAAVVYVLSIWLLDNILLATGVIAVLLLAASFLLKKGLSESAVMIVVVMAGFLLLDQVPFIADLIPGPVQRLVDRKAIWQDPWNNEVFGGDHIANSIWAMASGGVEGQGIGEGFAKTIPEAHTDMILPSMAEELGLMGILSVFVLFVVYLHRSIIIGRQTGTPFLFYLCAGIGISTFVQFLLIAGGSIGALPLSGVSLPFMSYGGSSLIINMAAAGFLLSASNAQGSPVQMKYITKQQDRNLVPALAAAFTGVILLGFNASQYLLQNKKWVVQPSLVADRSGARMFSYNPRIGILVNRLGAGNLLDREGRLLATGNPALLAQRSDSLQAAGLDARQLQALSRRRLDRYYPFGAQTFFWTGDMNTGIFMGGTNGYFAEYEHLAELRGFPAPATTYGVTASRYREDRFLAPRLQAMTITKRDYSALAPLLLAGINSTAVDSFKRRNRDVQLTIDAALQTEMQRALASVDSLRKSRVSVVVMEDVTGDVLTSASWPLPTVDEPEKLQLTTSEENKLPYWLANRDLGFTYATQPGSTAKLLTAMAAFNKLGAAAAQKQILIRQQDLVRTKGEEPDETGSINLERAIVKSNNPFFIRLANEERLQEEMGTLYMQTGMFLRGVGGYFYEGDLFNAVRGESWREFWRSTEFRSVDSYDPNNIRASRARGVSGMAWGQGELIATPAAVARVASAIANKGEMVPNRYVMKVSDSAMGINRAIPIAKDSLYAQLLTRYMRLQSEGKFARLGMYVAGKTGTPERIVKGKRINDGWYVFFAPKAKGEGHIVVCIRIESTKGSSMAVRLAGSHIIPLLVKRGYIKGFEK